PLLVREVIAEHDRAALHFLGEQAIELELRCNRLQRGLELSVVLELVLPNRLQHSQAGALVLLREHDVEAHDLSLVLVEQLVEEQSETIAPPGPAPLLLQSFLVDVDDDDTRVDAARHGEPQPYVVDDRLQVVDDRNAIPGRGGPDEKQHDQQPQRVAPEVLLHPPPFVIPASALCYERPRDGTDT